MQIKSLALSLAIALTSPAAVCATDPVNTSTAYDKYRKATVLISDRFNVPDVGSFFSPAFAFASLRGRVSDAGIEQMELLIEYSGGEWAFFSAAVDIDGNPLKFHEIDRQVRDGSRVTEDFTAELTRGYLESHSTTGFNVRFEGKYKTLIVELPSAYIQSFMAKLEGAEQATRVALLKKGNEISPNKVKLGVSYVPVTDSIASSLKMPSTKGVLVAVVAPTSAAALGGIRVGDIILRINDTTVKNTLTGLQDAMTTIEIGMEASFLIWRGNQETTLQVKF